MDFVRYCIIVNVFACKLEKQRRSLSVVVGGWWLSEVLFLWMVVMGGGQLMVMIERGGGGGRMAVQTTAAPTTAWTVRCVTAAAAACALIGGRRHSWIVMNADAVPSVIRVQRLVHRFVVHAAAVVVVLAGYARCAEAHVVCSSPKCKQISYTYFIKKSIVN